MSSSRALPRLFLGLLLLLSACQADKQEAAEPAIPSEPLYGGTLRIAASSEPDVLNSLITTSGYSSRILALVNDGLVSLNERLEWEPDLAQSWTWSQDGLVLTFHLRQGVQWSDGEDFSAYDVQRSYELYVDPRISSSRRSNFNDIESFTALDSQTVEVRFLRRSRDQLFNANLSIFPAHIVDKLDPEQVQSWPINRHPVGLGPYQLKSWEAGSRIVLERNPHYFGAKPYLDEIVFEFTPEQAVRLLRLEAGEVDMVENIPPKDEGRLQKSAPWIKIYPISGRLFGYLNYNVRRPFLSDARVRRAISHGIDRKAFTENLMFGRAQPAASLIPPALAWAHDPNLAPDAFDPELSRRLLAEAGFEDRDGDGVVEKDGKPFELEITTRTGDPVRENGALILQENLRQIGIKVKLRLMEYSAALAEVRAGRYDIYYGHFGSRMSVDPTMLVCTGGAVNYGGYSNPKMDALVEEGLATMDTDKAQAIWYEFQKLCDEEQPWTVLYYYDSLVGIQRAFQGCTPNNLSPFYGVEKWWLVPSLLHGRR